MRNQVVSHRQTLNAIMFLPARQRGEVAASTRTEGS